MKAKTARALCAINVGLLIAGHTSLAKDAPKQPRTAVNASVNSPKALTADQKLQINLAEKDLQEYEKQHGTLIEDYPVRLGDLARVYILTGQIVQAEKTITRAIESAKTFRAPELIIPGLMSNYAFEMAPYDKVKARRAATIGLEFAIKLPIGSRERLQYLVSLINFYNQIGAAEEANKQTADLDEQLRALENARGLDESVIETTAYTLQQMAGLFTDPNKRSTYDFKRAETYQLRAIMQFDKLPKEKRIVGHVALQKWYQLFGWTQKSNQQANIVKSLNNGKPYVKQVCHGCGLG